MIMNVVLVDVGADDESVFPVRKAFGKLTADLVCFLRRDLAGDKGLPEMISDHIIRAARPAGEHTVLPFEKKEFGVGCPAVTFIAGDEPTVIRFLRIFRVIKNIADCRADVPALAGMQRHQPRRCHKHSPQ
ncbi:hypothetical protein SDC9_203723 [bioreactor metagenome]|uniref:Uncharacterized protein n=1 Tax=bioreactor metagenome TaxID=1076179 RepID=A0A645IY13_9ZZZZ